MTSVTHPYLPHTTDRGLTGHASEDYRAKLSKTMPVARLSCSLQPANVARRS